jgi:hypothetical protein
MGSEEIDPESELLVAHRPDRQFTAEAVIVMKPDGCPRREGRDAALEAPQGHAERRDQDQHIADIHPPSRCIEVAGFHVDRLQSSIGIGESRPAGLRSFSVSVEDDATSGQHLGFASLEAASGSGVDLTGCDLALRLDREDFVTAFASRASASRRIASISSISSSVKIDRMPVSFVIVASSDPDALRPSWGPPLPRVARDFSRGAVLRSGVDRTAFDLTRLLVREDLLAASVSRLPSSSQSVRINSRSSSEKAAPMPLRFMAIPFDAGSLENAADPNYSAPGRRRD